MYYSVIRSPDYLEHHGIKGMKWGVWNEETRARKTGSSRRKPKKDYSKLSDKKLKRELTRRKQIKELKKMDAEEAMSKNPIHITQETAKKITAFFTTITALSVAAIAAKSKYPQALSSAEYMIDAGKNFIDQQFLMNRKMKWVL
jgi:hypothetical protein